MAKRMKEKTEKIKAIKDTRPYASVRYVRLSPTKAKIVIDTVRGKSYDDAVAILSNMPQDAAAILLKVVNLAEIVLGNGPIRSKGYNYHGRGRVSIPVTKTSHIKVVLDVKE